MGRRTTREDEGVEMYSSSDHRTMDYCTMSSSSTCIAYLPSRTRTSWFGDSFQCAYCTTVTKTERDQPLPRKCWACGAPRGMGT